MELAFVTSPRQNWFWRDLVDTLRFELGAIGVASIQSDHGFPDPRPDRIYVVIPPHEYVALEGPDALGNDPALWRRTLFVCGEQTDSSHFRSNVELSRRAGAVFDINAQSVRVLHRQGITAEYLPLGYSRRWDHFDAARERDVDVLFIGCRTARRTRHLAGAARILARWRCHIQLSDNSAPNSSGSPSFLAEDKWPLMARSRLVINLHQEDEPYFEWLRALDAIHCGCAFLTEHSTGYEPLTPGVDFFSASPESLALVADRLLLAPDRIASIAGSAYRTIRERRPMRGAARRLAAVASRLAAQPLPARPPARRGRAPVIERPGAPGAVTRDPDASMIRRALKDIRLDVLELRRAVARITATLAADPREAPTWVRRIGHTSAWSGSRGKRVSVAVALYNHASEVLEALDSVARSRFRDFEIVVVDDGSSDGSGASVRRWMRAHDEIATLLLEHPVNRGLGPARNTAIDFVRGEYCFVLDADNTIYPRCLEALVQRLDGDPGVAFAYPILESFGHVEAFVAASGDYLVSKYAWNPSWLRVGNYIDALALIRTTVLRELGGYAVDRRLYGLEDYDLWCRIADRGFEGSHIPEILARYRCSPSSMLSITGISPTSAFAALIERSPRLLAGIMPPG